MSFTGLSIKDQNRYSKANTLRVFATSVSKMEQKAGLKKKDVWDKLWV